MHCVPQMSHADVITQRAGFAAERLWNFIHVELRFRVVVMIKEWNSEFRISLRALAFHESRCDSGQPEYGLQVAL